MKRRSRRHGDLRRRASRIGRGCQSFEYLALSASCRDRLTRALRPSRLSGRDETAKLFPQSRKLKEYARFLPNSCNAMVEGLDGVPVSRVEGQ